MLVSLWKCPLSNIFQSTFWTYSPYFCHIPSGNLSTLASQPLGLEPSKCLWLYLYGFFFYERLIENRDTS